MTAGISSAKSKMSLPVTLRGQFRPSSEGMLVFSLILLMLGLGSLAFGFFGDLTGRDLGNELIVISAGFIVTLIGGPMAYYSALSVQSHESRMHITRTGLEICGTGRARDIPWSEIEGFRLGHASPKIAPVSGEPQERKEQSTGPVKVILKKGEYELPDRYRMSPAKLRSLLHRARMTCAGPNPETVPVETFGHPADVTPVLQVNARDLLLKAGKHLGERGFSGSVIPVWGLDETLSRPWISPEQGGYVLFLSTDQDLHKAMQALAEYLKKIEAPLDQNRSASC
ncbi:MAG: hypothetical protein WC712_08465 [Candidatus Brocadiia bacterium]